MERFDQILGRSPWVAEKTRQSEHYAIQLFCALCDNEFYDYNNPENVWSNHELYAAQLVNTIRFPMPSIQLTGSEPRGFISKEILSDILLLGWDVVGWVNLDWGNDEWSSVEMFLNDNPDWEFANQQNHKFFIKLRRGIPKGGFRIALCGTAGSGKDTLATFLSEKHPDTVSIAFADELKIMSSQMINAMAERHGIQSIWFPENGKKISAEQKKLLRPLWQWLGTDLIRNTFPNYWINRLAVRLNYNVFAQNIIVTDCRFENEAQWAQDNGFFLVRITGRQQDAPDHESERNIGLLKPNVEYENVGSIDDLFAWATVSLLPAARQHASDWIARNP